MQLHICKFGIRWPRGKLESAGGSPATGIRDSCCQAGGGTERWLIFDLLFTAVIVLGLAHLADWKARHPDQLPWLQHDRSSHLGAEYNCIAEAIRGGRGFADPFHEPTGPTAWMPPVLPYVIAGAYWLTGEDKPAVVMTMVAMQRLAVILVAWTVMHEARRIQKRAAGYLVLNCGLAAGFHELFQTTHDIGLLLFVVTILWIGTVRSWHGVAKLGQSVTWGAFGGFAALSSPVLGAIWAAITTIRWWPWRCSAHNVRAIEKAGVKRVRPNPAGECGQWQVKMHLPLAAFVAVLVVAPWMLRNRAVLGEWVPIKANCMYELWQSQCLDGDGVLDSDTCGLHPWAIRGEQRRRYREMGEVAYVAERGMLVRASIREQPLDFAVKVANRWFAACIYYTEFRPSDEDQRGGWLVLYKRLMLPIPLLGLFIILVFRKVPLEAECCAAIVIWILGLVPYIAVSYYDRYAAPLVGMKMLIVLHAWSSATSEVPLE